MVAGKNAGYSRTDRGDPNRQPPAHAHAPIDVETNPFPSTSSANGSAFDLRTTKPITSTTFAHEPVFPLVQRVKLQVERALDTAFSFDALTHADLDWKYVKPLATKFTEGGKKKPPACLVYALLVARVHFLDKAEDDLAFAGVNLARGDLCEILAIKMLSVYGTGPSSAEHLYVLAAPFNPFAGATFDMFADASISEDHLAELSEDGREEATNALELAISTKARRFVKSPLVQHVVKAIYEGDVMYSLESNHSLITDNYKSKPVVEIYDWRARPFLDHYRLKVPKVRKALELVAFASVFALFLLTEATYDLSKVNLIEGLFMLWSIGFALDEFASLYENGFSTYFAGAFNVLDTLFCLVFFAYLGIRTVALARLGGGGGGGGGGGDESLSQLAFDVLGLGGCVLAPRLMVSLIPDHVVVMALGRMARQFALFMVLAALTASGFLVTFHILARGAWSVRRIAWLMLRIWLSGAFLGFDAAQDFGKVFGPILMVAFAVLSQTLLLTILISLLSNTFANVQLDADVEIANQLAVRTMERVKSDPLSSYTTPVNIPAFVVLGTMRWVVSPRMLHKAQAFLARALNLPVLLFLALRIRLLHRSPRARFRTPTTPRRKVTAGSVGASPSPRSERFSRDGDDERRDGAGSFITQTARGAQKAFERLTVNPWEEGGEAVRRVFEFEVDLDKIAGVTRQGEEASAKDGEREGKLRNTDEGEAKGKKRVWDQFGFRSGGSAKSKATLDSNDRGKAKSDSTDERTLEDRLSKIEDALEILLSEMVRNRRSTDGANGGDSASSSKLAEL
ncbi:hypothetical protein JCM10212_001934 [Sporobolomyces blumeae]